MSTHKTEKKRHICTGLVRKTTNLQDIFTNKAKNQLFEI